MDIQSLTDAMNKFVSAQGWYEKDSPKPQTVRNLAISLNIEAAELLEHFQWGEELRDLQSFAAELADVALYLLQIASVCDIDLCKAIMNKLDDNYSRTWDD